MGYKSEVAVAVKTADYEKFIKGNSDFKNLMSIADISTNNEIVIIYWDWVKWCPEYEDIQKFESVLGCIADNEHPYAFVRLGEDYDDTEYRVFEGAEGEYLDEYIYPTRYIYRPTDWNKID